MRKKILLPLIICVLLVPLELYPRLFPPTLSVEAVSFVRGPDVGTNGGYGEVVITINGTGVLQITSISLQQNNQPAYEPSQIEVNYVMTSPGDVAASTSPNGEGYYKWYLPVRLILEADSLQTLEVTVTVYGMYGFASILTITPVTLTASH